MRRAVGVGPTLIVLGVLFTGALAGTIEASVVPIPGSGATLAAWRHVFDDPSFGDALVFSVRTTALSTVISAALAVVAASALRGGGAFVRGLFALPVPVPYLVIGAVSVLWLAPGGLADRALGGLPVDLIHDRAGLGIIATYVYHETPFLVLLILGSTGRALEQREEVAAVLGAGRLARMRWVLWPAVRLPLTVGSLSVAAFVFGAFEVPLVVGPNYPETLSTFAADKLQGAALDGRAQAAATLLIVSLASLGMAAALVSVALGRSRA